MLYYVLAVFLPTSFLVSFVTHNNHTHHKPHQHKLHHSHLISHSSLINASHHCSIHKSQQLWARTNPTTFIILTTLNLKSLSHLCKAKPLHSIIPAIKLINLSTLSSYIIICYLFKLFSNMASSISAKGSVKDVLLSEQSTWDGWYENIKGSVPDYL